VCTTPLRLLQAIDLYLSRLERSDTTPEAHQQVAALAGDALGLSLAELKVRQQEWVLAVLGRAPLTLSRKGNNLGPALCAGRAVQLAGRCRGLLAGRRGRDLLTCQKCGCAFDC
jgi:hypothetical protein